MGNSVSLQVVDGVLRSGVIPLGDEHPCPYLPGRTARNRVFTADEVPAEIYHALMDRGFRRSGRLFYQPNCEGCRECRAIRVIAAEFRPSKSQRRIQRINHDIRVRRGRPVLTQQKWRLYQRYLGARHDGAMCDDYESLQQFLYTSPVDTVEFRYYLQDALVGVSIADCSAQALSSVYMYFDPDCSRRSLGMFSVLWEIEHCRRQGLPYYYLGFYIKDCRTMTYKSRFAPHQLLTPEYQWI